jgi:hypothetical protein
LERGRYTTYATRKLSGRKRTIQLSGSFDDHGKYIRCWNCGFIVNVDRDLGDPERSGNYQTDVIIASQSPTGSGTTPICTIDKLGSAVVLIENGADGDPITDYYTPRLPEVARGCPLCGCTNL